jgi:hypothetical protein
MSAVFLRVEFFRPQITGTRRELARRNMPPLISADGGKSGVTKSPQCPKNKLAKAKKVGQ